MTVKALFVRFVKKLPTHKANELIPNLQCTIKKTATSTENHIKKSNESWTNSKINFTVTKMIFILLIAAFMDNF